MLLFTGLVIIIMAVCLIMAVMKDNDPCAASAIIIITIFLTMVVCCGTLLDTITRISSLESTISNNESDINKLQSILVDAGLATSVPMITHTEFKLLSDIASYTAEVQ